MTKEVNSPDRTFNGVCLTSKNPQSNAICERMQQTVTNVLRTLVHTNPPQNMTQAKDIIDNALATAMHAMRTTVATTLGSTLGALAFAQDMFLNMSLIADWQAIALLVNIMSMKIYNMPIGSNVSLTTLQDNKF
jgi:hypothetical protein